MEGDNERGWSMRAVLLTGAGIAVVDGVVLGVALGVGATGVAVTALALGIVAAVVLAWVTPDAPQVQRSTVTLGVHMAPTAALEPDEDAEAAATAAAPEPTTEPEPERTPALRPLAA